MYALLDVVLAVVLRLALGGLLLWGIGWFPPRRHWKAYARARHKLWHPRTQRDRRRLAAALSE